MLELITDEGSELERRIACLIVLFGEMKLVEGCNEKSRVIILSITKALEGLPEEWRREVCFEVLSRCK